MAEVSPKRLELSEASRPEKTAGTRRHFRLVLPCCGLVAVANAVAQVDREYFARTQPYPVYDNQGTAPYNLKIGKLTARLSANVQSEFNDNINLSEHNPVADFSIGPFASVGFLWPVTRNHLIQMDVGVGYRWYVNNPSVSSISVAPNTHLDYTIYIDDVRVSFYDRFSIQVDPIDNGQLSGATGPLTEFRRLVNTAGFGLDYQATRELSLIGGYGYTMDRSLTGSFTYLDDNIHNFYTGFNYALTPKVKAGILGSYSIIRYQDTVQNDGENYSVGPTLSIRLSQFITATASAGYTVGSYQHTGSILDESNFSGPTYSVGLDHVVNRRTTEYLRVGESLGTGVGSNYATTLTAQYGLNTSLSRGITLHGMVSFEDIKSSGNPGERAQRYLIYLGTGYQFTRYWSAGISYSLGLRDSDLAGHDYVQNRVTLDVTRRF